MELVAATKMRRAQEVALASRPYALAALDLLANVTLIEKSKKLPIPELLKERPIKKVLFVLVASDKGLAGSFNSSVFKKFEQHMEKSRKNAEINAESRGWENEEKLFAAVGEKAYQYLSKKGLPVVKKLAQAGDYTATEQVAPFTDFIVQGYLEKKWDRVVVVSTHFKSALKQEAHVRKILPVDFDHIKETIEEIIPVTGRFSELRETFLNHTSEIVNPTIEPSPQVVLEDLAKHLLFMQIYHLVLEANASEHSARRLAMKTASDNASELGDTLNLQYNKSRQAAITKEIIEISAGAEALA